MAQPHPRPDSVASVLVPAHNEERTIARLLAALTVPSDDAPFEIVVLCNGCTDGTADVARRYPVTVIELPEPSKRAALRRGHEIATTYPRVLVDADVEINAVDVRRLIAAVGPGGRLAAAPERSLPMDGVGFVVRWYYDVWVALPAVRNGLFGRGVLALAHEGVDRVRALPAAMADDLVAAEAFTNAERIVVAGTHVVVHPPRTVRDLVCRRARIATGNVQADDHDLRGASARTSASDLLTLVRDRPALAPRVLVFVAVSLAARRRARLAVRDRDFTTWPRDESSRR